jgi:hypothetical protein
MAAIKKIAIHHEIISDTTDRFKILNLLSENSRMGQIIQQCNYISSLDHKPTLKCQFSMFYSKNPGGNSIKQKNSAHCIEWPIFIRGLFKGINFK